MTPTAGKLLFALAAALAAGSSWADTTPVMVSLVAPAQLPSWNWDVAGFRLSLVYGDCRDFAGLDVGVVQRASGSFDGLGVGGVNVVNGRFRGVQAGLFNWSGWAEAGSGRSSVGVQYGGINYADSFFGLQSGYVNVSSGTLSGVQYGYVNCANDLSGVQCGGLIVLGANVACGDFEGCQIGIVNYAHTMSYGAQIGILNIIANNGVFPVLPIINFGL